MQNLIQSALLSSETVSESVLKLLHDNHITVKPYDCVCIDV